MSVRACRFRYDNIGTYNNKVVSLVVTNVSTYIPNEGKCGKGANNNGKKVQFGRINLGNNQACEFKYKFIYQANGLEVEIPLFTMSFFDFDHGTLGYGIKSLDAQGLPARVLNTTMITPVIPDGASKTVKNQIKDQIDALKEDCARVYDSNGNKIANGPGMILSPDGKVNSNGLDGVVEVRGHRGSARSRTLAP